MNLAHVPLRLATGAFFVNSGLSKRGLTGEAAAGVHGMAAGALPVRGLPPERFTALLSATEIGIGAALLLPVVPSALAGAALTAFAAGLVTMYWRLPGMHEPGSPRPTQQGVVLAKDVWLLGAGLTLVADDLFG